MAGRIFHRAAALPQVIFCCSARSARLIISHSQKGESWKMAFSYAKFTYETGFRALIFVRRNVN
jgi:hypothetical protein